MWSIDMTTSVPSLVGTLTSDRVGLGDSDGEARWIGIRRHQAVLLVLSAVVVAEGVMSSRVRVAAILAGLAFSACALPASDGRSIGEQCVVLLRYVTRSHWRTLNVRELGDDVVLWCGGEVAFRGYELSHRGRLDLSGRDVAIAESLAEFADAASAAKSGQHFSEHVVHAKDGVSTLLVLPVDASTPEGWTPRNALALEVATGSNDETAMHLFERLTYVRTTRQLVRIYRVRDFSFVPQRRGLLEQLLRSPVHVDVTLHVDVVGNVSAQRLASRAVHRVGSDDETTRSAGFRRTARISRNFDRLAQRERLVASGHSLLRVGVFVVVRAESLDVLRRRSSQVWRYAHDAGLRLDRGRGLQAPWYRAHLPGGPGW
jgi:hypothetical protein